MAISDTDILFGKPEDPDLNANKTYLIISSSIPLIVLAILAVILRFISRWVIRVPLMLDDWLILAALPFALSLPAIDIFGASLGYFGRQFLTVPDPLDYLPIYMKGLYVYDICYNFAIALSKLSMLAIYWRIFHARSFKLPLMLTGGATIAWFIACTLVAIFSCIPISGFWNRLEPARCIDSLAFFVGQAVCNIILDIVLLLIPVFRVFKLSISKSQKVAVSGIFLIGAFTTIASILRLNELIRSLYVKFQNPTFELVGSGVWSVIETNLSIVCACLPTMRPLLRLILHGSPYPTTGISGAYNRSDGYARSESGFRSRTPGAWPLYKRESGVANTIRDSLRISQPDAAHLRPQKLQDGRQWNGGWSDRPLVPNAKSFATTRRYVQRAEKQQGIEMEDRGHGGVTGVNSSGSRGSVGGQGAEIGVARSPAFDEVSDEEGNTSVGDETDTIKQYDLTRPTDGF